MGSAGRQSSAILYSVALHAIIVAAVALDIDLWRSRPSAPEQPNAIQATVVDAAVIDEPRRAREEAERQAELERQREEAERQAELERQREETQRQAELERQREEAERQAELERQREETQRQAELERQREETQRQAELERQREEAERQAELERQREEAERQAELERQRQEEERRRQEEARRQAELEAELQEQLAVESEAREAREAGLLDEYIRDIQNAIRLNWSRPASAGPGIECVVNVTQIPSGDVVNVSIGRCNGDAAVVRSIETAVLRASPLPRPAVPALFERNLEVTFSPDE